METISRIPSMPNASAFAMNRWFYKMHQADLLYHPDDSADTIVNTNTGQQTFTPSECAQLDAAIDFMFDKHGDKVYDVSMHYCSKALAMRAL
jgi:hypothetical protein